MKAKCSFNQGAFGNVLFTLAMPCSGVNVHMVAAVACAVSGSCGPDLWSAAALRSVHHPPLSPGHRCRAALWSGASTRLTSFPAVARAARVAAIWRARWLVSHRWEAAGCRRPRSADSVRSSAASRSHGDGRGPCESAAAAPLPRTHLTLGWRGSGATGLSA